jgi:hypothetical protein
VLTAFCQSLKIHDYSCNSPLVVPSLLLTVIDGLLLIDREYRRIKAKLVVKTLGTIGLISVSSSSQRQYHAYLELIVCALLQKRAKAQTA